MIKPADRYGTFNRYDALKLLALITMILDHVGEFVFPDYKEYRVVGRMAFPLFLFLIGYSGRWHIDRDLVFYAVAVTLTSVLTNHGIFPLNILWCIIISRLIMGFLLRKKPIGDNQLFGICLIALIWWIPTAYLLDYGSFAPLFAVAGYLHKHRPNTRPTLIFLYVVSAFHLLNQVVGFEFTPLLSLGAVLVMLIDIMLMQSFTVRPVAWSMAQPLRRPLQWAARNTLMLYALHVMTLYLIERFYFPERVAAFKWAQF